MFVCVRRAFVRVAERITRVVDEACKPHTGLQLSLVKINFDINEVELNFDSIWNETGILQYMSQSTRVPDIAILLV